MEINKKHIAAFGIATVAVSIGVSALTLLTQVNAQTVTSTGQTTQTAAGHHMGMRGPKLPSDVIRTVTNISNGVQIDMTSTNATTVQTLQSMPNPPTPKNSTTTTVTKSNLDNGVRITITSTDSTEVQKIQTREANGGHMNFGRGEMGMMDQLKNVKRTVTNLSNGVQINMTSTDATTVKLLQDREQKFAQFKAGSAQNQ